MYSRLFSRIYHDFGWNYYPEAFAETLLKWIEVKELVVRSVLDMGCGTGVLCKILRGEGIEAVGVDLSTHMIEIARAQDPDGVYAVGDMTTYTPGRSFDLVTWTGDALNHLSSLEEIGKAFVNMYRSLAPGGRLVFDLLNEKEVADDEPFDYDFSEDVMARFQMRRDGDSVQLVVQEWEKGSLRMTEVITERIYEVEDIRKLLKEAGFGDITVSHRLLADAGRDAITWYVTARKAG